MALTSPHSSPCGDTKGGIQSLKTYILSAVDEKEVFAKYLSIGISDILYCLGNTRNRISNPLRVDKNPSLSFKQYATKIIMIDYANQYYRGDIFEIVGKILNKDCNQSKDFIDICNHIIDHMNITYSHTSVQTTKVEVVTKQTEIDVVYRSLTSYDKSIFITYGLKYNTIDENIQSISSYSINGNPADYCYTQYDPCYCYRVNPNRLKLYFPNRKKGDGKFITNNKCPIENVDKIKVVDNILITKSIKDRCLLQQMLSEIGVFNVDVITLASESIRLEGDLCDFLKHRSKRIYVLFDNDTAGLEGTQWYRDNYGFIPIYFNMRFPDTKDPSDAVKKYRYNPVLQHLYHIALEEQWL